MTFIPGINGGVTPTTETNLNNDAASTDPDYSFLFKSSVSPSLTLQKGGVEIPTLPASKYPSMESYFTAILSAIRELKDLLYENERNSLEHTTRLDQANLDNISGIQDMLNQYNEDWDDWKGSSYEPITTSQNASINTVNSTAAQLNTDNVNMPANTSTFNQAAATYNTQATIYNNSLSGYNSYLSSLSSLQSTQTNASSAYSSASSSFSTASSNLTDFYQTYTPAINSVAEGEQVFQDAYNDWTSAGSPSSGSAYSTYQNAVSQHNTLESLSNSYSTASTNLATAQAAKISADNAVNSYISNNASLVNNYNTLSANFPAQQATYQAALNTYNAQVANYNTHLSNYQNAVNSFNSSANNGVAAANAIKPQSTFSDIPTLSPISNPPYSAISPQSSSLSPPVNTPVFSPVSSTLSMQSLLTVPTNADITQNFYILVASLIIPTAKTASDAVDSSKNYNLLSAFTLRSPSILDPNSFVAEKNTVNSPNSSSNASVSFSGAVGLDLTSPSVNIAIQQALSTSSKQKEIPTTATQQALGLVTLFANTLLLQTAAISGLLGIAGFENNKTPSTGSTTSANPVSNSSDETTIALLGAIAFLRKILAQILSGDFKNTTKKLLDSAGLDTNQEVAQAVLSQYLLSVPLLNLALQLKDPTLIGNIFGSAAQGTSLQGSLGISPPSVNALLTNPTIVLSLQTNLQNQLAIQTNINTPNVISTALSDTLKGNTFSNVADFQQALTANLLAQGVPASTASNLTQTAASVIAANETTVSLDNPVSPENETTVLDELASNENTSTLISSLPDETQTAIQSTVSDSFATSTTLRSLQENLLTGFFTANVPQELATTLTNTILPLAGSAVLQNQQALSIAIGDLLYTLNNAAKDALVSDVISLIQFTRGAALDLQAAGQTNVSDPSQTNLDLQVNQSTNDQNIDEQRDIHSLVNVVKSNIEILTANQDDRLVRASRELLEVFINPDSATILNTLRISDPSNPKFLPLEGGGVPTSTARNSSLPV